MRMNRRMTVVAVCLGLLLAAAAYSQEQPAKYYRTVQFLKVPADSEQAYLEFLRTNTRRIVQLRMKSEEIVSWAVLKLVYEGSPAQDYNYLATVLHAGTPMDPSMDEQDQMFRQATGISRQEYNQKLMGLRTSAGSLLAEVEAAVPGSKQVEGNYISVTSWKITPMQGDAYTDYVRNFLLPLQTQNVKDGYSLGWAANRIIYPAGEKAPFDAVTATVHRDLASALKTMPPGERATRFSRLFPEISYVTFVDRGRAQRTRLRTELFKVMIADEASELTSGMPDERTTGTLAGTP